MKIVFLILIGSFILALVCVYVFIPSSLMVRSIITLHGTTAGIGRALHKKEMWSEVLQEPKHFTPSSTLDSSNFFWHLTDTFYFAGLLQNGVQIRGTNGANHAQGQLAVFPFSQDSVVLQWSYLFQTSINPVTRFQQYWQAVDTKKSIDSILYKLKIFLSIDKNVYGFAVIEASTKDTFLVSTKCVLEMYPSTEQIYTLIYKLREYAKEKGAAETDSPMMNVTQLDKDHYSVMIALPVNKPLTDEGNIIHKQMIPGHFLTTIITGGNETVNNTYFQMQQYFQDYGRTSMAIPFLYLITDRSTTKDTSRWVTKLCFPVM